MPHPTPDLVDELSGLPADHPLLALRRRHDAVRAATQASFETLFEGPAPAGLSAAERELVALRVAVLQGDAALAGRHRDRARARGADIGRIASFELAPLRPADPGHDLRSALLAFVDRLTLQPATAKREHLDTLRRTGLPVAAIVSTAQAIAFTTYAARVLAGLRALAQARSDVPLLPPSDAPRAGANTVRATPPGKGRFTAEELGWAAWLPTVDPAQFSDEQRAVLDESHAAARSSPYYLTLVHDAPVLRARSRLFNAVMYGPGALPRAERELATVAVSRINGCTYCASVHARLFVQLTKDAGTIERLFADGVDTPLPPRRRAVVDLAVALSANPPALAPAPVDAARAAGLDDEQVLGAVQAAAMFAWANRLMQTLGEPTGPLQD